MTNIVELKDLRTKEELVQYFKMLGTKITDEEIDKLKASFEQAEQNSHNLTLQQLDSVAGGIVELLEFNEHINHYNVPLYSTSMTHIVNSYQQEKFDKYVVYDDKHDEHNIRNVFLLEKDSTPSGQIDAKCIAGTSLQSFIEASDLYYAIKFDENMYIFKISSFNVPYLGGTAGNFLDFSFQDHLSKTRGKNMSYELEGK